PAPVAEPALATFATFCALARRFAPAAWPEWPAELRDPASPAVRRFAAENAREVGFHVFLQRLCREQLGAAAEAAAAMPMGLFRDLAVGAAPDGAEAWSSQGLLAKGVSIGAPPDPLGPEGQVWNLPPFDPHALASCGYDPFVELIETNMAHAGALRIDHAMGLARLFWVPEGGSGRDGSYVSYPLADLLGETALASVRARCAVVAEALGTVPEGFNEELARADMLAYRVALLERDGPAFRSPAAYPALSVACLANHDLPTFAGWWQGADIAERAALGLERDPRRANDTREADKRALLDGLGVEAPAERPLANLADEVHASLAAAPSAVVLVQAEDLALEPRAVNMPGTDRERPNWRRRLAPSVAELFAGPGGATLARVAAARASVAPSIGQ
ncbi:MAG: 4-alpha-glucanotransferase, partial [Novosphingobium sp.]